MTDLKERTFKFALEALRLYEKLEQGDALRVIGKQFIRSGTSVGANYRSALKARSKADFISKNTIAEEEADETVYWLELLKSFKPHYIEKVDPVLKEAKELTAILTASGKTAKFNLRKGLSRSALFFISLSAFIFTDIHHFAFSISHFDF